MNKMRPKDPEEPFASAYIIRPMIWFAYQFSGEAKFIRKYRRKSTR